MRIGSRPLVSARGGPAPQGLAPALDIDFGTVERFRGVELPQVISHLAGRLMEGFRITVWCENPAEAERFVETLRDNGIAAGDRFDVEVGPIRRGFSIGALKALVPNPQTARVSLDRPCGPGSGPAASFTTNLLAVLLLSLDGGIAKPHASLPGLAPSTPGATPTPAFSSSSKAKS